MRREFEARLRSYVPASEPLEALRPFIIGAVSPELQRRLNQPVARAAVLIGLQEQSGEWSVVMTQRAEHLQNHPGQVAFPGGRIEVADPSIAAAALREAHEEIGLTPADVEVVAQIDDHITGTGFVVTPIVGFVAAEFVPVANANEVAAVFNVPLRAILDESLLKPVERDRFGTRFINYELQHQQHLIWGATAAMLATLRKIYYET